TVGLGGDRLGPDERLNAEFVGFAVEVTDKQRCAASPAEPALRDLARSVTAHFNLAALDDEVRRRDLGESHRRTARVELAHPAMAPARVEGGAGEPVAHGAAQASARQVSYGSRH